MHEDFGVIAVDTRRTALPETSRRAPPSCHRSAALEPWPENLLLKRLDFTRCGPQQFLVFGGRRDFMHQHPSLDAPLHRVRLVVGETHTGRPSHDLRDPPVARSILATLLLRNCCDVRMPGDARDLRRDTHRRQYEIHAPVGDSALRHGVMLRAFILGKGDAALGLVDLQPERAIGTVALPEITTPMDWCPLSSASERKN